ncbi:Gamma-secretase-activating protein C-terminal domain [Trinorchestia longiramus]|nr:Gamma-secretase-activating protein C-terminal domain [Trinorchestia longiramus]
MAVFTSKPLLFLEENQYCNFDWVGETNDGCLLCVWEEEVLLGSTATSPTEAMSSTGVSYGASGSGKTDAGLLAPSLTTATHIAIASPDLQSVQVLYTFDKVLPVVQTTVNSSRTLLGYVTREEDHEGGGSRYSAFVAEIAPQGNVYSLNLNCDRQILLEFLNTEEPGKQQQQSSDARLAKLLVLVHRDSISVYSFALRLLAGENGCSSQQTTEATHHSGLSRDCVSGLWVVADEPLKEGVCGVFVWAQWSPALHHLYYLHHRLPPPDAAATVAIEDDEDDQQPRVMLTVLQFHASKPHETVLNVPLELAGLDSPGVSGFGSDYRDEGLLHTTADPWLDLRVVASPNGALCICHHYIYKSRQAMTPADPAYLSVFVAYSVTLLHQGCVLHAVLEEVPWTTAQTAQPSYSLMAGVPPTPSWQVCLLLPHGRCASYSLMVEHYLVVIIPDVCCHLLDVSLDHPPTPHLLCPPPPGLPPHAMLYQVSSPAGKMASSRSLYFVECNSEEAGVDGGSRVLELRITKDSLYQYFKSPHTSINCKLAVLHMAAVHDKDHDLTRKLVWSVCSDVHSIDSAAVLQEYLVSETYSALARHLQSDSQHLLHLLPLTTHPGTTHEIYTSVDDSPSGGRVRLSYCPLENAPIMLLAPRERVVRPPYADTWTRLHQRINTATRERFSLQHVVEKLLVSFETYKPEALSQGMTPLSPASPLVGGLTINSLGLTLAHLMFDPLPFNETESTTSSKLEHLLSVSLRELSMYCLKHFPHESPMRVHAVASKYVCTQLQVSRRLCSILCSSLTVVPNHNSEKGFSFIEQLEGSVQHRLFALLERYYSATDAVAFPLPQGYNSFFAYLAYRVLPRHVFQQYLHSGVLHLNVDVLREIIYDSGSDPDSLSACLELLSCAPAVRSVRALQYWPPERPGAVLLTARHHAAMVLHGEGGHLPQRRGGVRHNNHHNKGCAFPTSDRTSPYTTLVDLLTAKAKLSELDVGLLHDGTVASSALAGLSLTARTAPN